MTARVTLEPEDRSIHAGQKDEQAIMAASRFPCDTGPMAETELRLGDLIELGEVGGCEAGAGEGDNGHGGSWTGLAVIYTL